MTSQVEVSFETAWYPSAQNTMHVSPTEVPPQLEFTPTPLCVRVPEQSICKHDGQIHPTKGNARKLLKYSPQLHNPLRKWPHNCPDTGCHGTRG